MSSSNLVLQQWVFILIYQCGICFKTPMLLGWHLQTIDELDHILTVVSFYYQLEAFLSRASQNKSSCFLKKIKIKIRRVVDVKSFKKFVSLMHGWLSLQLHFVFNTTTSAFYEKLQKKYICFEFYVSIEHYCDPLFSLLSLWSVLETKASRASIHLPFTVYNKQSCFPKYRWLSKTHLYHPNHAIAKNNQMTFVGSAW